MKTLVKKLKPVLNKRKEIVDLILFGSVTKGGIGSNDVDIAVVSSGSVDRISLKRELGKKLERVVDLQILDIQDYNKFIWVTLIREGYSVRYGKFLHQVYRIKPVVLYKYSLKELTKSKKVMFDRAIKKFENIEKLSNRVVLVPVSLSGEFAEFLESWSIDFDSREYGLLPLVRKRD